MAQLHVLVVAFFLIVTPTNAMPPPSVLWTSSQVRMDTGVRTVVLHYSLSPTTSCCCINAISDAALRAHPSSQPPPLNTICA